MNDRGQSDNDLLRRSIINVATDLNAIEVKLRESGESEQVCDLLKTLRLKLKKESSFVAKYRPREPTLTLDEWIQEIATSTNESMAKICPALTGVCGRRAVENVEFAALEPSVVASIDGNVASPVSLELSKFLQVRLLQELTRSSPVNVPSIRNLVEWMEEDHDTHPDLLRWLPLYIQKQGHGPCVDLTHPSGLNMTQRMR